MIIHFSFEKIIESFLKKAECPLTFIPDLAFPSLTHLICFSPILQYGMLASASVPSSLFSFASSVTYTLSNLFTTWYYSTMQ